MASFFDRFPDSGYVCAHRGARSIAPENTLAAMMVAHGCGADLWETDVQMSADEELVLFHDRSLIRTTDIAHQSDPAARRYRWLRSMTLLELQRLDAGSWFVRKDPFGTIAAGTLAPAQLDGFAGQRIPMLRETLTYCRHHSFPVNLEIKGKLPEERARRRVELLLRLVHETSCEDLVLVSSFHHEDLQLIKHLCPSLATAALVESGHPENVVQYLRTLGVEAYHPQENIVDAGLVALLRDHGIRVNTWTVNDEERFRCLTQMGVTFICTDWPQRMVAQRQTRC